MCTIEGRQGGVELGQLVQCPSCYNMFHLTCFGAAKDGEDEGSGENTAANCRFCQAEAS
jgi:hypothetical protein